MKLNLNYLKYHKLFEVYITTKQILYIGHIRVVGWVSLMKIYNIQSIETERNGNITEKRTK
jgi:hypothetical protein